VAIALSYAYYIGGSSAQECDQGPCNSGYSDKTEGNYKWWACGVDCPGGTYYTDGYCNCACIPTEECIDNVCKPRGPCDAGYMDQTDGNWNWWACGSKCAGGQYYTDGVCNCACVDEPDLCDGSDTVCYARGPCDAGYMDETGGKAKYWACGVDCPGGKYWTDGVCNCACVDAGQCAMTPFYHSFNLYTFAPSLSFIRTFGVWGEYLLMAVFLTIIASCTVWYYKSKMMHKVKKVKYVGVSMEDSASEIECAPMNK